MRQGQQYRRGRGRPNNNRGGKGQNPLTRSHESNGPDVKIRGTPSHIAEKYITLARDSLASGDIVMAENYLQHAEHYNRIIMTYREQMQPNADHGRQGESRHEVRNSSAGAEDGYRTDDDAAEIADQGARAIRGTEPQPVVGEHPQGDARPGRSRRTNDQRGNRSQRSGGRQSRNKMSANGTEQQPRSTGASRRRKAEASQSADAPRNPSAARTSGGPKISDGQEPPGFLRNPVAPTRRRRPSEAKSKPAETSAAPVVEEDGA